MPGNLLKAANNAVVQGSYAYDGLDRRIESKEGASMLFYAYLGTEILFEHQTSGADTDYIYASGMCMARVTGYGGTSPTVNYFHLDSLGSTRLVTDPSGKVVSSDNYQPCGQDNGATSGSETYKFTGKPYSAATGLYYYGARWYDATIGRFISQDPYPGRLGNPQTLNPYTYVLDNPTNSVDPSGEVSEECAWTNCCDIGNFGGCISSATASGAQWYGGLSPEEKQVVGIGVLALSTFATGGTDLLFVGAAGFGMAAGAYTGYTYATGGTPTMSGALEWGSIGFGLAVTAYGGYQLGSRLLSRSVAVDVGPGGAVPNWIGNSRVGQTVWDLIDSGISPEDIAVEETFQLRSGQLVRPDVAVYRNGELDRFIEVKGGYASGTRALDQLSNYAQLAEERNISLTYKLFKSGSESFLSRLRLLHVPF